ncbi:MAG: nucleotide exchange factor GrpE [Candidatus Dependentiae bacterium]
MECVGEFDPAVHEALMQTQSDEHESGAIVAVLSKGYRYKDTVVRHAKVSVAA